MRSFLIQPRFCFRLIPVLFVVCILLTPKDACAGSYDVSYSGGSWRTTPALSGGNYSNSPNSAYTRGGGQSPYASTGTTASVTCSGTITATFTWNNGGNSNDLPPQSVVLKEYCEAYWGYVPSIGTGTYTGSCFNPLGGSPVPNTHGPGTIWDYTKYSVKNNPGSTFQLMYSPTASGSVTGSVTGPTPSLRVEASVTYGASASPVTINPQGTTPDSNGAANILIGQSFTGSLGYLPFTPSGQSIFSWAVSGQTFQDYVVTETLDAQHNPNASTATLMPGPGPLDQPTVDFFWNDNAGPQTVTCNATLQSPSGPLSVTAVEQVNLQEPTYAFMNPTGRVQINNHAPELPGYALYAGPNSDPVSPTAYGIDWKINVNTPSLFTAAGRGGWHFVQIIRPNRWRTPDGGLEEPSSINGLIGLDTTYPYEPSPYSSTTPGSYPADNTSYTNGDSPGNVVEDAYNIYRVSEGFDTYVMYRPPGNSTNVQWVPLHKISWSWSANVRRPQASWSKWIDSPLGDTLLDPTAAGTITVSSSARETSHPTWASLVRAPQPPVTW